MSGHIQKDLYLLSFSHVNFYNIKFICSVLKKKKSLHSREEAWGEGRGKTNWTNFFVGNSQPQMFLPPSSLSQTNSHKVLPGCCHELVRSGTKLRQR